MPFCCENTKKAYDLILRASGTLDWSNSFGAGDFIGAVFTLGVSSNIKQSGDLDEARSRMGRARSDLGDAQRLINSCACENQSNLLDRLADLRSDYENLKKKYDEKQDYWYQEGLRLSRNEERVRGEGNTLRDRLSSTSERLIEITDERNQLRNERDQLRITVGGKDEEITALQRGNNDSQGELARLRSELTRVETERDERITATDLQELLSKIEDGDQKITSLQGELNQSQESGFAEKVHNKEQKLKTFTHRLGIDWGQVQLLREISGELVRAQKDGDMDSIRTNKSIIETIEQNLLQIGFYLNDIQELCERCEEIAQLNLQLEQQFEARIEVPTNH